MQAYRGFESLLLRHLIGMTELFSPAVLTGFAICSAAAMATTLGAFSVFSAREANTVLLAIYLNEFNVSAIRRFYLRLKARH